MDSSKGAKKGIMIVAAVILAIAGIAIIQGCATPENLSDALMGTDAGVTLNEALRKVGSDTSLPDTSVVGEIEKVILSDQDHQETGKWGMGVLYDSGIKLWIQPGEEDLEKAINEKVAPYTDGRQNAFERKNILGRQTLVGKGGFQIIDNKNTRVRTHPILLWNKNGTKYQLRTNSDMVTVGDLIKAAESIK